MAAEKRYLTPGVAPGHHNYTLTLTPKEGTNAGTPFVFNCSAFGKETGGGVTYVQGNELAPIAIVANAAEPSGSFTISNVAEGDALIEHIKGSVQDTHCTLTIVRKRERLATLTWTVEDFLPENWAMSSDSGGEVSWEVSFGCTDILYQIGNGSKVSMIRVKK